MYKTYHVKTYGCQMNVYDSERMGELLEAEGYAAVDEPTEADLVILNTCHIREKAAEKVYSDIGRLRVAEPERLANGRDTLVAVAGCVAQAEGAEIFRRSKTVNMVFGPQTYHRLPVMLADAVAKRARGFAAQVIDTDYPAEAKFDHLAKGRKATSPLAFLTIQEGCDKFCTFCVVPYTRGAEVSRPPEAIEAEARSLVANGVREITLLGQNVNAYHGNDANGHENDIAALVTRLSAIDGLERLRYTTSHPLDMSGRLIEAHVHLPKLMPYLHLPVQSGSDTILKAMNRRHTADEYLRAIDTVRAKRADIALSGDFIVGFPGETDKDFDDTLKLVTQARYAAAYTFKYSPRPGTPAAESDKQVPENIKADRLAQLQALLNVQHLAFNAPFTGTVQPVLIEKPGKKPQHWLGKTPYLQLVNFTAPNHHIGDIVNVHITAASKNSLEGNAIL